MTHKRNTSGLINNAQKKRQNTIERAEKAIDKLVKSNDNISFEMVAKTANVSKAWLYKEKSIAERIIYYRSLKRKGYPVYIKNSQRSSDASKGAIIVTLKERIKRLEGENYALKKQLEVAYGQIHSFTS